MNISSLFGEVKKSKDVFKEKEMCMQFGCGSHQGMRREKNEDNFFFDGEYMPESNHGLEEIILKESSIEKEGFFAVFDGIGGMDFGEIAAYTAAKYTRQFLEKRKNINSYDIATSLNNLCHFINEKVFMEGLSRNSEKTGTTLAGLYFCNRQVWTCNVGDSPVYLLRDGRLIQISQEHTDIGFVREKGLDRKPWLTQYLGIDPEEMRISPYIKERVVKEKDCFLICSDGLTDMVSEQRICNILIEEKKVETCVKRLIKEALQNGGIDNITVIVCRIV